MVLRRSAPFVLPQLTDNNQPFSHEKTAKKQAKVLLSTLQADIAEFRDKFFPPPFLTQIQDLPIYSGNLAEVQQYHKDWQTFIERAKMFYPSANMPPDYLPLPASLEIPQFVYHVQRLHLTRTKAKESKNFGSVGALINKCGQYSEEEITNMTEILTKFPTARLVAHREFIDLRAYVFCRDNKGEMLNPERIRFYRTGLVIHHLDNFKIVDSRKTPRKTRNDAYKNPIANNDVWKIFIKYT